MARPTADLNESESNSPPMERPSKHALKPEYNSDWNSRKKAIRDKAGNSSVINPSAMNNFEMKNHKKDYIPTSDKKPGNSGSFSDAKGGIS